MPPESTKFSEFQKQITASLEENGIDLEKTSVADILQRLQLVDKVDRETMRQVLRADNYQGTERIRRLLQAAIDGLNVSPDGERTKRLLVPLLKDGRAYFTLDAEHLQRNTDIYMSMLLIPHHRHMIRCADDQPKADGAKGVDYLNQHVKALIQEKERGKFASATLVTTLSSSLCDRADRGDNIEVINRSDFLIRFFDHSNCRRELIALAQEIGISLDNSRPEPSLKMEFRESGDKQDEDQLFSSLSQDEKGVGQSYVAFVSGTSGIGKTALCYRLAWRLLDRPEEKRDFSTPVIVSGSQLKSPEDVVPAIRESIDRFYRFSADEGLVRELIQEGRLIVFIDSLSEVPYFNSYSSLTGFFNLPGIDSNSGRYLLTLRPEVLPEEDFTEFRVETARSQASSGALHLLEIQLIPDVEAELKKNDALGPWLAGKLASDSMLAAPLQRLCSLPFFFRRLVSAEGKATLTELLRLSAGNTPERARILYALMRDLASRWSDQLFQGIGGPVQQAADRRRDLYELCELACGMFFQFGSSVEEKAALTMPKLLELIGDEEIAEHLFQKDERRLYLNRLLRAAPFILKQQDGHSRLELPDDILLDFFLAEFLKGALLLANKPEGDETSSLRSRAFARLARSPLTSRHKLLPLFIAGALQNDNQKESVLQMFDRLRKDEALLRYAATADGRYLMQNVVFIVIAAAPVQGTQTNINLSRLSLSGCDFGALNKVLDAAPETRNLTINVEGANCEFVHWGRLESNIDPREAGFLSRGVWDAELFPVPQDTDAEVCKFAKDCPKHKELQWSLVPGNVFTVPKYARSQLGEGSSDPAEPDHIWVGSFWIQQNPVTNLDFLKFLCGEPNKHRKWQPAFQRSESKNDYYLRGWDKVLQSYGEGIWSRKPIAEIEKEEPAWCKAPLVYVSWSAAKAYALSRDSDLPTEAEFEAAARYFQDPDHGKSLLQSGEPHSAKTQARLRYSDYPWGSKLGAEKADSFAKCLEGYALFADFEKGDSRELIPETNLANEDLDRIRKWKSWADAEREKHPTGICPVAHLVGGIRHWMADAWSPAWPSQRDLKPSSEAGVVSTPYQDAWSAQVSDSSGAAVTASDWKGYRTLRGGSQHLPAGDCRISYRAAQRETNINPDVGFRCVKRLWPRPR